MQKMIFVVFTAMALTKGAYAQGQEATGEPVGRNASNHQSLTQPSGFVGIVGVEGGINYFDDVEAQEDATGSFVRGDANLLYHVPQSNWMLGINGFYRNENIAKGDLDVGAAPAYHWEVGGKVLKRLGSGSRIGIFVAAGQDHFAEPENAHQPIGHIVIGPEAQIQIDDDLLLFGQLGIGDAWGGYDGTGDEDYGFGRGYVIRGGLTWFGCLNSAITGEVEFGGASSFTGAGDDAGEFTQVSLYGTTPVPVNAPLFLGYGVRHRFYDSSSYGDTLTETEGFLRLSYVWGATTAREIWRDGDAIGNPVTPARAGYHGWFMYEN